jgi:hypothetical protein
MVDNFLGNFRGRLTSMSIKPTWVLNTHREVCFGKARSLQPEEDARIDLLPPQPPTRPTSGENQITRQTSRGGILIETFERWSEDNAPLHPFQAAVRILFACALYQTHDPLKLQQLTGLPLPFTPRRFPSSLAVPCGSDPRALSC